MKRKTTRRGSAKDQVERLPPTSEAARDEGPRLIPLERSKEPSRLERYLDLANTLLGRKPGPKTR